MYRCFYCKDPVTKKEHQRVQAEIGSIVIDESDGFYDDDLFDDEAFVVVCQNCIVEADIEALRQLEVK